jgi:hypothetical protein
MVRKALVVINATDSVNNLDSAGSTSFLTGGTPFESVLNTRADAPWQFVEGAESLVC